MASPSKVAMEISEKARVEAIRAKIRDRAEGAHPEDVSWVAAEAYRLHVVRENLLRKVQELNGKVARYESWLASVAAGVDEHDQERMDGSAWSDLAGGWQAEAAGLLDGSFHPETGFKPRTTDDREPTPLPTYMVIEYHYEDGDIGSHPLEDSERPYAAKLWAGFATGPEHTEIPAQIVLRPATSEEAP